MHEDSAASGEETSTELYAPAEWLDLPVEAPLTASYNQDSGELTLESTLVRRPSEGGALRLRLRFTADATHGFVRMLEAVEERLGISVGANASPTMQQ